MVIYIDVRRPEEYAEARIPDAVNYNLEDEEAFVEGVKTLVESLPADTEVVLYCHSSFRSSYAQSLLASRHSCYVGNLDGGLALYQGPLVYGA
jgi:rhodanese-related sulfurtransferase